ncbi:MAG: DNA translocase FtsK 4TM domain-containing protein [Myxococcaceae bacterium]|nr:DNA translocase FtsK 4TM domain-containing protein [Myxococcaceae bacterium]
MSAAKRIREKRVLSRQEVTSRRRALNEAKMSAPSMGKRAIIGVVVFAAATLAMLSVATFDAADRVGPGFHNLIGPVGHAVAEVLRGFLGVCAYVLPLAGFYVTGLIVSGDHAKRRWPQVLCLALLLVSSAVLAELTLKDAFRFNHSPGGLLGSSVAGTLTALFSTVGTVVLVSALAAVALIVGTQFAFLRFCAMVWGGLQWAALRARVMATSLWEHYQERRATQKAAAEKAAEEEAAFLAQLEEKERELLEMESAVQEAEEADAEAARVKAGVEAARAARQAAKDARLAERETKRQVREDRERARQEPPMPPPLPMTPLPLSEAIGHEPAWAMSLPKPAPQPPPLPAPVEKKSRKPNLVEPLANAASPEAQPMPLTDVATAAPAVAASAVTAKAAPGITDSAVATLAHLPPPSSAALARMPVIVEPKAPPKPTKKKEQEQFEFVGDRKSFSTPPIDVLEVDKKERTQVDKEAFFSTAEKLRAKLADFGIEGEVVEIRPGPVVTMYEFQPGPGIKISRIAGLADDLAMAMEAMRVRIVAPIPGKGVVGIEVPNKDRETVFLKEIAEQDAFQKSSSRLTMCLGKDIEGMPYVFDLAKAPHLLMAGTTGSGKSVAVNAMIMSILLKSTPEEVRFIMVDPKMLELSVYEGIPHLLLPVVTDPRKASLALQWAVDEMSRRYKLLSEAGVRNIASYNQQLEAEQKKKTGAKDAVIETKAVNAPAPTPTGKKRKMLIVDVGDETAQAAAAPSEETGTPSIGVPSPQAETSDPREGLSLPVAVELKETAKEAEIRVDAEAVPTPEEVAALAAAAEANAADAPAERKKLPYIVVIIDELADLMMVASKEVETSIARLAQMARAAGIHLMVATQRPSTDVVTGVIKANFPTRISFMLRSKPDSMTILGTVGAEALLGMGDMLIMPPTSAHLQRVHGCFVSEKEIKRAVDHLKAQGKPVFDDTILKPREEEASEGGIEDDLSDELYDQAVAIVSEMKQVSISMLQRKMRIGYNRAARMIERMERDGMVGAADGAKPRDVLIRPVGEMPGAGAML